MVESPEPLQPVAEDEKVCFIYKEFNPQKVISGLEPAEEKKDQTPVNVRAEAPHRSISPLPLP